MRELKKINNLKQCLNIKINNLSNNISKKDFDEIIKIADKEYLTEIKEYVQNAYTKTIEIITNKEELYVNRCNLKDISEGNITSISDINDLKYDDNKWTDLLKELDSFITI